MSTRKATSINPVFGLLLPVVCCLVIPSSVLAFSKAEEDSVLNDVNKACDKAQIEANKVSQAIEDLFALKSDIDRVNKEFDRIAASVGQMSQNAAKLFDGAQKAGNAEYDDIAAQIAQLTSDTDDLEKRAERQIRDANNADSKVNGYKDIFHAAMESYDEFASQAEEKRWIGSDKVEKASDVYDKRIAMVLSGTIRDSKDKYDKAASGVSNSAKVANGKYAEITKAIGGIRGELNAVSEIVKKPDGPIVVPPPKVFTVQFANPDGTAIDGFRQSISESANSEILKPKDEPKRDGYKFRYWSLEKDANTAKEYTGWGKEKLTADKTSITLFAIWDEIPVTLSFYLAKNSEKPYKVVEYLPSKHSLYNSLGVDDLPKVWGFEFAKWVDADGNSFQFDTYADHDAVVYGSWKEIPFQVRLFDADEDEPYKVLSIKLSEKIPDAFPADRSFSYDGWTKNPGATKVEVASGASLKDVISKGASSLDLYVVRSPRKFSASFFLEGVDGRLEQCGETLVCTAAEGVTPPQAPAKLGWKFDGWFAEGSDAPYDGRGLNADTSFVAKYSKGEYKVKFMLPSKVDGSDVFTVVDYSLDKPFNLPEVSPTIEGWNFSGWSIRPDEDVEPDFNKIASEYEDRTIYARGKFKVFTVEFFSLGTRLCHIEVEYGQRISFPGLVDPAGDEMRPLGWAGRSNAQHDEYWNEDFPVTKDMRLCAVWDLDSLPQVPVKIDAAKPVSIRQRN